MEIKQSRVKKISRFGAKRIDFQEIPGTFHASTMKPYQTSSPDDLLAWSKTDQNVSRIQRFVSPSTGHFILFLLFIYLIYSRYVNHDRFFPIHSWISLSHTVAVGSFNNSKIVNTVVNNLSLIKQMMRISPHAPLNSRVLFHAAIKLRNNRLYVHAAEVFIILPTNLSASVDPPNRFQ